MGRTTSCLTFYQTRSLFVVFCLVDKILLEIQLSLANVFYCKETNESECCVAIKLLYKYINMFSNIATQLIIFANCIYFIAGDSSCPPSQFIKKVVITRLSLNDFVTNVECQPFSSNAISTTSTVKIINFMFLFVPIFDKRHSFFIFYSVFIFIFIVNFCLD